VLLDGGRTLAAADSLLTCFEGELIELINVGCFVDGPLRCVSDSDHFFGQWVYPDFTVPHQITGVAFISNDGATVWPSVGVVLVPTNAPRYPTAAELANLQVRNVPTPYDTAVVVADLRPYNIVWNPGMDVVVCLQFPEGGELVTVGQGPGILADNMIPDQTCDRLTFDAGRSGDWFAPDPTQPPIDWGFAVLFAPASPVLPTSWGTVKTLYRSP
jgi:hypothetical protein